MIVLLQLIFCPGEHTVFGRSDPGFKLDILELAFDEGESYRVTAQNSRGPAYYLRMTATGRKVLKGMWLVDEQTIGLFEVLLHAGNTVDLRGRRVPRLPTGDLGLHELTVAFTNYEFSRPLPVLRYYVVEGGAIIIQYPETGDKVRVSKDSGQSLQLQWQWDNAGKKKRPVYQVMVTETPPQFLTPGQIAEMWTQVGPENRYTLDLSPFRFKRKKWIYWQVRALKPSGELLSISEISSFKLVRKK